MAPNIFPTKAEPAAATNSDGFMSLFHDQTLETPSEYHE